jgi:hypothetical protein
MSMDANKIVTFKTMAFVFALSTASAGMLAAQAQTPAPPSVTDLVATAPGKAAAVSTANITALVTAVDGSKRTVTLKRPDGSKTTIDVPDEVKNFDQIKVGDTVRAQYTMALALELKKGPVTAGPVTEEREVTPAPAAGEKPGRAVGRKVTAMTDVIAVDAAKHIVTLKGPRGNQVDLEVHDPEQLKNIAKGDHVQVTYVEALALSVEPTKKAAASK